MNEAQEESPRGSGPHYPSEPHDKLRHRVGYRSDLGAGDWPLV